MASYIKTGKGLSTGRRVSAGKIVQTADVIRAEAAETAASTSAAAALADRTQTGLDAIATAADRIQTGLDRTQTGLDASSAGGSAATATTKAGEAATSATNAANSATTATTQATNASGSATTATTQAGNAATSATSASSSATDASTSAAAAATSATNAATSATNSANSASAASASATTATTQATNATNSATLAADWAEKPDNTDVTTAGTRSARHWSNTAAATLAGKSDVGHAHSGADITSGTIADARLPTSQAGKTFTGATQFASGTAALPGVTFSGDTNTGVWRPAADTLAASTNGFERMRISTAGRVGIGTANPGGDGTFGQWANLDVVGNDGNIRIGNTETDATIKFGRLVLRHYTAAERNSYIIGGVTRENTNEVNIGGGSSTLYQATQIQFFTAANTTTTGSTERMRINSAGNLLIGHSSDSAPGIGNTATGVSILGSGVLVASRDADIPAFINRNTDGAAIQLRRSGNPVGSVSLTTGSVTVNTTGFLAFGTSSVERMRIDTAGNVGIGTSSPTSKLDVHEEADAMLSEGRYALNLQRPFDVNDTGVGLSFSVSSIGSNVGAKIVHYREDTLSRGGLAFFTKSSASAGDFTVERMRIATTGNVGIRTVSPLATLHIDDSGTASTDAVIIQRNDTAARKPELVFIGGESGGSAIKTGTTATPGRIRIDMDVATTFDSLRIQFSGSERFRITSAGNVGIGTSAPDAAALLDVTSTTKGFLPPRMTTTQRDAISTPPNGLLLYNSTTNKMQARAGGAWVDLH